MCSHFKLIDIDTIQYRQKHLFYMKLLSIRRKTETENRYSKKNGTSRNQGDIYPKVFIRVAN